VTVSATRGEHGLEVAIEDNGSGFAFSGSFNLDELDRLHAGPISIKRRIRLLEGELRIDSKPGEGAKLKIRVPL
jgi:signal transduction histidine kinase